MNNDMKVAINDTNIRGDISELSPEELAEYTIVYIPYPDVIFEDFRNKVFSEDLYSLRKEYTNKSIYNQAVVSCIRKKYSIDDELAIVRQRTSKPVEYAEYESYCEQAKAEAKLKYKEQL